MRVFLLSSMLVLGACTSTRDFVAKGYALPERPLRILMLRPDVEVGSLNAGGLVRPDAEWTERARTNLVAAIEADQRGRGNSVLALPDQEGERGRLVADYQHLHEAVAGSIAQFKYGVLSLPTKKDKAFDWTLGPGVAGLGEGDYALFFLARDSFATSGRVALSVIGLAGCVIGLCAVQGGGERFAYASLVDLKSGDIVWFNVLQSATGDMRTPEGATATVETLFESLPVNKVKK